MWSNCLFLYVIYCVTFNCILFFMLYTMYISTYTGPYCKLVHGLNMLFCSNKGGYYYYVTVLYYTSSGRYFMQFSPGKTKQNKIEPAFY